MKLLLIITFAILVFSQEALCKRERGVRSSQSSHPETTTVFGAVATADTSDFVMRGGDKLVSANGRYELGLSAGGNLALYDKTAWKNIWESKTSVRFGYMATLTLTTRGNLVLDEKTTSFVWVATKWETKTGQDDRQPYTLTVKDDGNVVLMSKSGLPYWTALPIADMLGSSSPYNTLLDGQKLTSANGRFVLLYKYGDLTITDTLDNSIPWTQNTDMASNQVVGSKFVLQSDKNMVIYGADTKVYWSADTQYLAGDQPCTLKLRNSGSLALMDWSGKVMWSTLGLESLKTGSSRASISGTQQLMSPNGRYTLSISPDDLSLRIQDTVDKKNVWTQQTAASGSSAVLEIKTDGNLVLTTTISGVASPRWTTAGTFNMTVANTRFYSPYTAKLLDNGVLAFYDANNKVYWINSLSNPGVLSSGNGPTFLGLDQSLTSSNKRYSFQLELNSATSFLYAKILDNDSGKPTWTFNFGVANAGARLVVTSACDIVATTGLNTPLWSAGIVMTPTCTLKLLDTGSLVLLDASNNQKWINPALPTPDRMVTGSARPALFMGDKLTSPNGQYKLTIENKQVLEAVIFDVTSQDGPVAVWRSKGGPVQPDSSAQFMFLANDNLALVDKDKKPVWSFPVSAYKHKAPVSAILDNSGVLSVVDADANKIWSTAGRDRLGGGLPLRLNNAETLISQNGQFEFSIDKNFDFKIWDKVNQQSVWSYATPYFALSAGDDVTYASVNLNPDSGNLELSALYAYSGQTIQTGECIDAYKKPIRAIITNDGAFQTVDANGNVIWSTQRLTPSDTLGDQLAFGSKMVASQQLLSPNGRFSFALDDNRQGRIRRLTDNTTREVWVNNNTPVSWSVKDYKAAIELREDGRFVIKNCLGREVWTNSRTANPVQNGPYSLQLTDDGNLVIEDNQGSEVWSTHRDRVPDSWQLNYWGYISSISGRYRLTLTPYLARAGTGYVFAQGAMEITDMDTNRVIWYFYSSFGADWFYLAMKSSGRLEFWSGSAWYGNDARPEWMSDRSWGPEHGPYTMVLEDDGALTVHSSKPMGCDCGSTKVWSSTDQQPQVLLESLRPTAHAESDMTGQPMVAMSQSHESSEHNTEKTNKHHHHQDKKKKRDGHVLMTSPSV